MHALFSVTSETGPFPTTLDSGFVEVTQDHPTFTGLGGYYFVAVLADGISRRFVATDGTFDIEISPQEANTNANLELGESLTRNGETYFVYRVINVGSGKTVRVDTINAHRVVAWQDDINTLLASVDRIDAELNHGVLSLPDAVVHVLENDVTVTEESTPTESATDYNESFVSPAAQTIFRETAANGPSAGQLNSKPISDTSGTDRARRKLMYITEDADTAFTPFILANDGGALRELVTLDNGVLNAQVFVPAQSAGSTSVTVYPAPANRFAGNGVWQNIPTLTFRNGVPVTEADELFFTRNLPQTSSTLTINYRGHANGNIFGTSSTTLAGVGGASEVSTTFVLTVGSETATAEVRYYPNFQGGGKTIRVSVTERVNVGLPTIQDVEVILSFSETRTIPAQPATERPVRIGTRPNTGKATVIGMKPSADDTVIIVGEETEVDTRFPYTTAFGASENGHLTINSEQSIFFDYEDFVLARQDIVSLQNHAPLPSFGLFTTNYTVDTTVELDTTLEVQRLNISNIPTSASGLSSGDVWNDSGTLKIVT